MKSLLKKSFSPAILLLSFFILSGSARAILTGSVHPDHIEIGTDYDGQEIMISGTVSKNEDILVRITGAGKDEKFKKKGKVFGLLWMNLNTIEMKNVPSMMLIAPSDYIERWRQKNPEAWKRLGLGFEAVKEGITLLPENENKDMIFHELLKLKEKAGMYGICQKAVRYTNNQDIRNYEVRIALPGSLPQGDYSIEIFGIGNGRILDKHTIPFSARQVGFPAFLSDLAFNHGLLYGILAVIIAIMGGLIIGFLFKGGKGSAH